MINCMEDMVEMMTGVDSETKVYLTYKNARFDAETGTKFKRENGNDGPITGSIYMKNGELKVLDAEPVADISYQKWCII